jgi:hypothetical protein
MTWLSPEIIQGAANATELAERLRASGPEGLDDLEA